MNDSLILHQQYAASKWIVSLFLHFAGCVRLDLRRRKRRLAAEKAEGERDKEASLNMVEKKRERGLVVTAGTDFIGLSSLYIFLLQGVAAPAFSRFRTCTRPLSLVLSLSLSPSLCFHHRHFYSPTTRPILCTAHSFQPLVLLLSLSCTPISHLETNHSRPFSIGYLFAIVHTIYATSHHRVGILCSSYPFKFR